MTLDRRRFVALTATGALAASLAPRMARAAQTLTGVTYLPPSYKALTFGSNGFVERLKAGLPEGTSVEFYDSGQLLDADQQLPALRSGTIDFMFHTTSYITRSVPILGITGLPGVVEAIYENPERIADGSPLFELMNAELAKDGLYMLSLGGNIMQPEYLWSTGSAPIRSIDDIDGKKVRVVSFEASGVIEDFGGAAVRVPSSELYLALQRGTVDAAVANISTVIGRSLQEQLRAVYKLPITGFAIGIFLQKSRWEAMDPAVKTAMQEAAAWFNAESARDANDVVYPQEYWPMIEKAGLEIVEASAEDLTRLETAAQDVLEAWKQEVGPEIGARAIDLALGRTA